MALYTRSSCCRFVAFHRAFRPSFQESLRKNPQLNDADGGDCFEQGFQSFPRLACRFTWCLNYLDEPSCKTARFKEAYFVSNTTVRCTTDSYIPLDLDCSELVCISRTSVPLFFSCSWALLHLYWTTSPADSEYGRVRLCSAYPVGQKLVIELSNRSPTRNFVKIR